MAKLEINPAPTTFAYASVKSQLWMRHLSISFYRIIGSRIPLGSDVPSFREVQPHERISRVYLRASGGIPRFALGGCGVFYFLLNATGIGSCVRERDLVRELHILTALLWIRQKSSVRTRNLSPKFRPACYFQSNFGVCNVWLSLTVETHVLNWWVNFRNSFINDHYRKRSAPW